MVFYVQGIRMINGGGGKLRGPDFFNPGRLVGKFSQLTSLFNFIAVNRQGCLFDGSLEHASDFLQQAFFFPIPLQAVLRAALRVFYFRIDFRLSGDHGRQ